MDFTAIVMVLAVFVAISAELAFGSRQTHPNKAKFLSLSSTMLVNYNSPTDFAVLDLERGTPYVDVTDYCTERAKRIISEEIVKRERQIAA